MPWRSDIRSGYRAIDYRRRFGVDWSVVSRVCRDSRSLFVTSCWQDPTSEIILLWLMLKRRPYLLWNDTPAQHRRRNLLKRVLRQAFLSLVFRRSAGVMATGKVALEVFAEMGCPTQSWRLPILSPSCGNRWSSVRAGVSIRKRAWISH
jgi:hypothetical protein